MPVQSEKNQEKLVNKIMFLYILGVAISGWGFVMIMLNGGVRECVFLLTGVAAIITKVFEKQLGSRAKYVYACIPPVLGAVTAAVGGSSESAGYVCLTHYYFVATLLLVLYYEQKILKVSTAVTIVVNAAVMIVFPAGFLKLHLPIGWIFTGIVYVILFVACSFIVHRTTSLFGVVEDKEKEVESVLDSVQMLSGKLYEAGTALSQISENESAAAQELAATSEELVGNSNMLGSKTDESMNNLSELKEWESVVADNVEKVEKTTRDLLDKSQESEKLLNDLHKINGEVSDSMQLTTEVARKLSDAVQEIGVTLKLISDISSSTNLLALNASIEAARAGESGKGFAVVATEIGALANQSTQAVGEISKIINDLVSKSVQSLQIMEKVNGTVEHQVDVLNDTQSIFKDLYANLDQCMTSIVSIEEMTEDIERQRQGITTVLDTLNSLAQDNAASSQETSAMTEELGQIVSRSKEMVEDLKGDVDHLVGGVEQFSV